MATFAFDDGKTLSEESHDNDNNIFTSTSSNGNVIELSLPGTPVNETRIQPAALKPKKGRSGSTISSTGITQAVSVPAPPAAAVSGPLEVSTGYGRHRQLQGNTIDFAGGRMENAGDAVVSFAVTVEKAIQCDMFDDDVLNELPSAAPHRPNTAGIRQHRESAVGARKASFAPKKSLRKRVQVYPQEQLALDAPKRLQERENVRGGLSKFRLFMHDLKQWWQTQRTRRRDPVPIWRGSIKNIEGRFGSGMTSFFVFLRYLASFR